MKIVLTGIAMALFGLFATTDSFAGPGNDSPAPQPKKLETATFGAGCFWCVEAIFESLEGVESVVSGYSGGHVDNPTYDAVCAGTTGHAEVVQLKFDPEKISFDELLEVFWLTHDPTTMNRQGYDTGTQYRSAVFYHNEAQKLAAEKYKKELNEQKVYDNPIVTEVTAFSNFFAAERYHQDYYRDNGSNGYCKAVIQPKMEKFKKVFKDKLKS